MRPEGSSTLQRLHMATEGWRQALQRCAQVAQLSGFVSADTAYHHGETSLQSTIIGLAHNFVGSNNVNVLVPAGEGRPHLWTPALVPYHTVDVHLRAPLLWTFSCGMWLL